MRHEMMGRMTACPCSGWWRTNVAEMENQQCHLAEHDKQNLSIEWDCGALEFLGGWNQYLKHHRRAYFLWMDTDSGSAAEEQVLFI